MSGRWGRRWSAARGVALVALALGGTVVAASQAAAQAVEPERVRIEARVDAPASDTLVTVVLSVPDGWTVYDADPGEAGLSLRMEWVGKGGAEVLPVEVRLPEPREAMSAGYRVRLHEGEVRVVLRPPPPGLDRPMLRIRWGACRGDLCVPGVTELRWER